jgi:hypothetical protein
MVPLCRKNAMPTLPQQPEEDLNRTLSFRVTTALWERVGIVARRNNMSIQALCTDAVERKCDELEAATAAA